MKRGLFLLCFSMSAFSKGINPLCENITSSEFITGDGSAGNPYLICNQVQFNRLADELPLLTQNFQLGADLSFANVPVKPIGSNANPFSGNFNGDNYTLSDITIAAPEDNYYVGIFGSIQNNQISNMFINGLNINENVISRIGGLAGNASNATISNLHISALNMKAPDFSGGLVGFASNSTISISSVEGVMINNFGTDASGGLVGYAFNTNISTCATKVTISNSSLNPFGVSDIGGLVGALSQSTVTNVFAIGNIDYSNAEPRSSAAPDRVGGIAGSMINSSLQFAYYAGVIQVPVAEFLGGAVGQQFNGVLKAIPGNTVFWDITLSGVTQSAVGSGETTTTLQQSSFWLNNGFNTSIWQLMDGQYPKLAGIVL